jgi:hypothetical protein
VWSTRLHLVELAGAALIWKGIADFNWAISLIIAGAVAIAAVEIRARA